MSTFESSPYNIDPRVGRTLRVRLLFAAYLHVLNPFLISESAAVTAREIFVPSRPKTGKTVSVRLDAIDLNFVQLPLECTANCDMRTDDPISSVEHLSVSLCTGAWFATVVAA